MRSTCRSPTTAAGSSARTSPSARRRGRARGGVRRGPRRGATRASWSRTRRAATRPGRRGLGWLKMKKALATHRLRRRRRRGRPRQAPRRPVRLHVRRPRRRRADKLVNIGKAYSGLTDAEIAEMTALVRGAHDRALRALPPGRADGRGRDRLRRHRPLASATQSGFSLRFPRIARPAAGQVAGRDRHGRDGDARCTRASSTAPSCS